MITIIITMIIHILLLLLLLLLIIIITPHLARSAAAVRSLHRLRALGDQTEARSIAHGGCAKLSSAHVRAYDDRA